MSMHEIPARLALIVAISLITPVALLRRVLLRTPHDRQPSAPLFLFPPPLLYSSSPFSPPGPSPVFLRCYVFISPPQSACFWLSNTCFPPYYLVGCAVSMWLLFNPCVFRSSGCPSRPLVLRVGSPPAGPELMAAVYVVEPVGAAALSPHPPSSNTPASSRLLPPPPPRPSGLRQADGAATDADTGPQPCPPASFTRRAESHSSSSPRANSAWVRARPLTTA